MTKNERMLAVELHDPEMEEKFKKFKEERCDCKHTRAYHKASAVREEDGLGWDSPQIRRDDEIGDGLCVKCRNDNGTCMRFSTFDDDVVEMRKEVLSGRV